MSKERQEQRLRRECQKKLSFIGDIIKISGCCEDDGEGVGGGFGDEA